MARNKRKIFPADAAAAAAVAPQNGIPCPDCQCRHSYVVKTERFDATIRRLRRCRNCGRSFYTSESA